MNRSLMRILFLPCVFFILVEAVYYGLVSSQARTCGTFDGGEAAVFVYAYAPVSLFVSAVVIGAAAMLSWAWATRFQFLLILTAVSCILVWAFVSATFSEPPPDHAIRGVCPGGVPSWWPGFIPLF